MLYTVIKKRSSAMREEDTDSSDEDNAAHGSKKRKTKSASRSVDLEEDLQLTLSGPVYDGIDIDDDVEDDDDGVSVGARRKTNNDDEDCEPVAEDTIECEDPPSPNEDGFKDNGVCQEFYVELC